MKTSDKLLLCFFLSAVGIFGVVHLTLYAMYRQGDFLSEKELEAERFFQYQGPAPACLSLQGNLLVRVIPSDSFSVEMEKGNTGPDQHGGSGMGTGKIFLKGMAPGGSGSLSYRQEGDSLIISGNIFPETDPGNQWQVYYNYPRVTVHAGQLKSIRLSGGMVILKGGERPDQFHTALLARKTLVWIGEFNENTDQKVSPDNFDSVSIDASNCKLVLHQNASIRQLTAQLKGESWIDDLKARVDRSSISCSPNSRISMTGANLKNLQLPIGPAGLSPPDH
jgi:hypothetical protein